MGSLYRFISFPAFVNLVERRQERYVQPTLWEDTYEGYLLQLLSKYDVDKCLDILADSLSQGSYEMAAINYLKLYDVRWHCYGQCWTKLKESDALWRIYSYGKMAVRIETDEEQIRDVLSPVTDFGKNLLIINDVQYDLDDANGCPKTKEQLLDELHTSKRIADQYFHKRKAFEHEQEKRVIFVDPSKATRTTFNIWALLYNWQSSVVGKNEKMSDEECKELLFNGCKEWYKAINPEVHEQMKFFPINNLDKYIKSVMVHPQAEEWIVELVECICRRVRLNFCGKSQMYSDIS